jgi:hypothetical protein
MSTSRVEYENIDDNTRPRRQSIYENPVFDDHEEVNLFFSISITHTLMIFVG